MKITRAGTTPSIVGPADWFTGKVRVDSLFPSDGGRRSNGGIVTFEPGTHPLAYPSSRANDPHYAGIGLGAARE